MSQTARVEIPSFNVRPSASQVFEENTICPEDLGGGPSTEALIAWIYGSPEGQPEAPSVADRPNAIDLHEPLDHDEPLAHREMLAHHETLDRPEPADPDVLEQVQRDLDELRVQVCFLEERGNAVGARLQSLEHRVDFVDQELERMRTTLDRTEDPEQVSELLADLVAQFERWLPETPKQEALPDFEPSFTERVLVSPWRRAIPPALIAGSLLLTQSVLTLAAHLAGLPLLATIAPWMALAVSVPMGLALSNRVARRFLYGLTCFEPGDQLVVGGMRVTLLTRSPQAWELVDRDQQVHDFLYLMFFYYAVRLDSGAAYSA